MVHISYADLPGFGFRRRNSRFKEEMEMRTSSMWPWLARMGIEVGHTRPSCHEGVPLLNLNLIHHVAIGIAVYNLQQSADGK